jgi:hypothetical protein
MVIRWWLHNRKLVPKVIRRGFDSLFFLIGWLLWKERNVRTFSGITTSALQFGGGDPRRDRRLVLGRLQAFEVTNGAALVGGVLRLCSFYHKILVCNYNRVRA